MSTCLVAVKVGDLQLLVRLHEAGGELNSALCSEAAEHGYLDCLKYLHNNGCAWDRWTCANAAANNHLDCLQYAHENGCHWSEATTVNASLRNHVKCLQYAVEHGCHCDIMMCAFYSSMNGNFECFQYLYQVWVTSHSPQSFWIPTAIYSYLIGNLVSKIDLEDSLWRNTLFVVDLKSYPDLQDKVEAKKQEILDTKHKCEAYLQDVLLLAVIRQYIHCFI